MDNSNWLWNSQPPVGSKRPSLNPAPTNREVKKPRTQPIDDGADNNIIDNIDSRHNVLENDILDNVSPFPSYGNTSFSPNNLCCRDGYQLDNGFESQPDNFTSGNTLNASFNPMAIEHLLQVDNHDPGPYANEQRSTLHLGVPNVADRLATETYPGTLPFQPHIFKNFLPPLAQLDISMGDTAIHDTSVPSRPFEESQPSIGFSIGDSRSSHSQGQSTPSTVRSEIDVSQSEKSLFSESQTNRSLSQSPAASLFAEPMEVDSDYDTCFGVVLATPTSSFSQKIGAHSASINMKQSGGILMLYHQSSGSYAGILNNSGLANALRQLHLKLDATLFVSGVEDTKGRKHVPVKAAREYVIRIVFYGLQNDKESVGGLLSDAGCFLQHPSANEVIPGVRYDNPHYLLRPGAEMPKLQHLRLSIVDDSPTQTEPEDELSKSRFLQIFEAAEADGRAVTVVHTSPSPRLRSKLMSHQIAALAMMHEKESGYIEQPMFPSLWRKELVNNSKIVSYCHTITGSLESRPIPAIGGILADDMGLGKTLSVLALICSSLDLDSTTIAPNLNTKYQGTLIVTPKSTIYGWMSQASQHIHKGQIRIGIYYGSDRKSLANQFRDTDVVITTYETLRSEWEASEGTRPLFSWKWLRVVLDEAHHIRNRSRKTFQSVCELESCHRWCLTGTPIHNSLDDYGALLSFIRVYPFMEKTKFTSLIVQPIEEKHKFGIERLQSLIRATCLRRMKQKTLELPQRFEKVHQVHLHKDDQALYDFYKKLCAEQAAGQDKRLGEGSTLKSREHTIVSLITYLRRICDHGEQLLPDKMKKKTEEYSVPFLDQQLSSDECSACGGEVDNVARARNQDTICIDCANSEEGSSEMNMGSDSLSIIDTAAYQPGSSKRYGSAGAYYQPSAKVLALLENLEREQAAATANTRLRKSVVFSSWVKMLDLVEEAFHQKGIGFQRIDGQTSLERRRKALQEFNDDPEYTVMLATIGSAAEGINLTAASIVHLLEPHWNPMVEAQAVDRVHRIGQMQEVTIIRYIVPNSVETYVRAVQDEKMQIINRTMNMNDATGSDLEFRRWEKMKEMLA